LKLTIEAIMWADLIFILFRPTASRAHTCVQWAGGRIHAVMVHVGF